MVRRTGNLDGAHIGRPKEQAEIRRVDRGSLDAHDHFVILGLRDRHIGERQLQNTLLLHRGIQLQRCAYMLVRHIPLSPWSCAKCRHCRADHCCMMMSQAPSRPTSAFLRLPLRSPGWSGTPCSYVHDGAMVVLLNRTVSRVRRVNRQRTTIGCLDLEMIVDAATGDVRDVHAMTLYTHICGVNIIHHDIERDRATLRFFPGAQDEMGATAQLEHRKIRLFNNGANAKLDEEICSRGNVANQQSDMTNGNSWTRIVHHGSPDEGKNLGAEHRHAGSYRDRLIIMLHHSTEPSLSVHMRTRVLHLHLSLHFPKDADVRVRVIHYQNRSLPRYRFKQILHQLALLRPRIGKKHANVGDGDLHAVVAQWPPGLGGVVVVAHRRWPHQGCSVTSRIRLIARGKETSAENLCRNTQAP